MKDSSVDARERYAGCRLFVSPNGFSGFSLGVEGEREGWLYDCFANPRSPRSPREEQHRIIPGS